jgi:hypothetical protein
LLGVAGRVSDFIPSQELTETYRPPIPAWAPEPYKNLIEACWEANAYKRPTFQAILVTLEKEILPVAPVFPPESK